jgi:hypothetical protein
LIKVKSQPEKEILNLHNPVFLWHIPLTRQKSSTCSRYCNIFDESEISAYFVGYSLIGVIIADRTELKSITVDIFLAFMDSFGKNLKWESTQLRITFVLLLRSPICVENLLARFFYIYFPTDNKQPEKICKSFIVAKVCFFHSSSSNATRR